VPSLPASPAHTLRAVLLLVGAQAFFTLLDATGKRLAQDMGIPLISFARHAGQIVVMLLLIAPRHGRRMLASAHPRLQWARGLAMSGFTMLFFTALMRLPQAEATAINFIAPLLVMLLAGPLLGEHVPWTRWVGAGCGFFGMLAIVRPGAALDPIGVGFALLTVVCNVGFQLLTRRLATLDDTMATVFRSALIACAASAAMLPLQERWGGWPATLDTSQLLLLLSMGVTGTIGQLCFIRAYYWSSASFIAPLVYLQLLWAVASGRVFFAQFPDMVTLLGMSLIVASGIGTMFAERYFRQR
jgi:drug/metabolite transporter (DMT)-like permease